MAPPPKPPPPGYFDQPAKAAAAAEASASSTPPTATPLSYTDTIADVTPFIPITLDLAQHNYYHWRHLFEVHLGRCNLRHHVAADAAPRPDDARWITDDLAIIQWIYTRVSTEIFNLVFREAATAAALWASLRQLFQDNADARINNLHSAIRNTPQGDSSLSVYCQRIQTMADELRELGDPMPDRQLINILLQGLSDRFKTQAAMIPFMRPRPSFAEIRSLLQNADDDLTRREARPHVFAASTRPPLLPTPAPAGPTSQPTAAAGPPVPFPASAGQPPPGWRPSPNYKGKNPMYWPPRSATPPAASTPAPAPAAPPAWRPPPAAPTPAPAPAAPPTWRPPHDPWTGMVQAWSMPWAAPSPIGAPPAYTGAWAPGLRPHTGSPGLLGQRAPPNAYHAAPAYYDGGMPCMPYQHPQMFQPSSVLMPPAPTAPLHQPTSAPSPSWDQSAFLQAMNNFAAQGNSGYSDEHKGYRCLDLVSGRVHISRHVSSPLHRSYYTHTSASYRHPSALLACRGRPFSRLHCRDSGVGCFLCRVRSSTRYTHLPRRSFSTYSTIFDV
ncbi:hypothetical protein QYE76_065039 [Lolium multiflorum]|uniref:Retroviral polymerase SH3-like domain-containing protein n=1 Tax=Lolium multiflorum TaxID=4521 RepID=A0AAD8S816_LOLMU|nr:hypothetical protein QYE76_065039 [Lolium multiflorum]